MPAAAATASPRVLRREKPKGEVASTMVRALGAKRVTMSRGLYRLGFLATLLNLVWGIIWVARMGMSSEGLNRWDPQSPLFMLPRAEPPIVEFERQPGVAIVTKIH